MFLLVRFSEMVSMMRLLHAVSLLFMCLVLSGSILASHSQAQKSEAKPLNNSDVLDMLNAGISQDVVIAKIKKTMSDFDTSSTALKALKVAHVTDAVLLAMVEASGMPPSPDQVDKTEVAMPARVNCNHSDPVPVFSAPGDQSKFRCSLQSEVRR
jgi:hypothetical protein